MVAYCTQRSSFPNLYDILVPKYCSVSSISVSLLDFLSTFSQKSPQQVLQIDVTFMSAAQSVHAEVKHFELGV